MERPRLPINQLKYFSLFSGIGGFELGIQKVWDQKSKQCEPSKGTLPLGNKSDINTRDGKRWWQCSICIGFSEIDKYATQIYKKHFPTHKEYGNVSEINWSDTENFDLLVGGFPCQAFSIAGKRQGFDDTRGTLFFEIARCLKEKQPRLLLLENVKGLLSHDKGRTFGVILNTLDELGYDLQWQVLNSKNFGVPQNRERVFIVGHLRGGCRPEVFPIGENAANNKERNTTTQGGYSTPLTCRNASGNNARGTYISYALDANYYKGVSEKDFIEKKKRQLVYTPKVRRLTPTECERLQGFPDGWTEGISDTQRYKCLGNAVTVNVIETIVTKLLRGT